MYVYTEDTNCRMKYRPHHTAEHRELSILLKQFRLRLCLYCSWVEATLWLLGTVPLKICKKYIPKTTDLIVYIPFFPHSYMVIHVHMFKA